MEDETFEEIGLAIGKLVAEKNAAYGDSFGKSGEFLGLLYPSGIRPEQYRDALCLVRIFDKMMRVATDKKAFGESPYRDITGYGIVGFKLCGDRLIQTSSGSEIASLGASGEAAEEHF
jgi:hypothetical protein